MTLTERRAILHSMFAGLYFDSVHQLRKVSVHSPFDRHLGLILSRALSVEFGEKLA